MSASRSANTWTALSLAALGFGLTAEAGDKKTAYTFVRKLDRDEAFAVEESMVIIGTHKSLEDKPSTREWRWEASYKDRPNTNPKGLRQRSYSRCESLLEITKASNADAEAAKFKSIEALANKTIAVSTPMLGTKEYLALPPVQRVARRFVSLIDGLLPGKTQKVGGSWKVRPQLLQEFFFILGGRMFVDGGRFKGTHRGRLDRIGEEGGRKIATISYLLKGRFLARSNFQKSVSPCKITGTLRWDLDGDYPLSLELKLVASGQRSGRHFSVNSSGRVYATEGMRVDRTAQASLSYRAKPLRNDKAQREVEEEKKKPDEKKPAGNGP